MTPTTRSRLPLPALLLALGAILAIGPASAEGARTAGTVLADGDAVAGARVIVRAATPHGGERLAVTRADDRGRFRVRYRRPEGRAVIYAVAVGGHVSARRDLRLLAVADPGRRTVRKLAINELTTVAGVYSLSRFLRGSRLRGAWPGLPNAAATVPGLVDPARGVAGEAISNPPNGTETDSLATLRTLASILGGCAGGSQADCRKLLRATEPPRGQRPGNTLAAMHAIARNPTNNVRRIFDLPRAAAYGPTLPEAPASWVLTIKHTDGGYDGPGRMAFDSRGNIWVTNNFEPPGLEPGLGVISLDPAGHPRNGSPVTGGGIKGNWWGIAVDERDRVWLSNFTGDDPHEFYSPQFKGGRAASLFTRAGRALSPAHGFLAGKLRAPQGIAVDQDGDVLIANHGNGTVTRYPGGRPGQAEVISGGGLYNPFTIAVDARGGAWVDNGSLDGSVDGSLSYITPRGKARGPFGIEHMRSPQGMAIDSAGNLWVASLIDSNVTWISPKGRVKGQFRAPSIEGAWGVAVDGADNVWVASFLGQKVSLLCGRRTRSCPPGTETGEPISPPLEGFTNGGQQHITAVQVDQSGNVWAANNWAQISPTVGGDGLVEYIGAAPPVRTPLIGPPRRPRG